MNQVQGPKGERKGQGRKKNTQVGKGGKKQKEGGFGGGEGWGLGGGYKGGRGGRGGVRGRQFFGVGKKEGGGKTKMGENSKGGPIKL